MITSQTNNNIRIIAVKGSQMVVVVELLGLGLACSMSSSSSLVALAALA